MGDVKYFAGVDPGASGGIAIIGTDGYAAAWPFDGTEADTGAIFAELAPTIKFAFIEDVHSFPGQGVSSTFKFGRSYGFLRGLIVAHRIPFDQVHPRTWQKSLGIGSRAKDESQPQFKQRLKAKAQQLYPFVILTLKTADAMLLAEYCRRTQGMVARAPEPHDLGSFARTLFA